MNITGRAEAKSQGSKRYFTGKPCKYGHIAKRRTDNGGCVICLDKAEKLKILSNHHSVAIIENKRLNELKLKYGDRVISYALAKRKGLFIYFNGKPCVYGHISDKNISNSGCSECARIYRETNRDKLIKRKRNWYVNNELSQREYSRNYQRSIPIEIKKATNKKYKDENADKIRKYYKDNPHKAQEWARKNPLSVFIRRSLYRIEKAKGCDRIEFTEAELGYSQVQFITHMESQFVAGMSWENRSEWHIDHIKPLSLFIKEGITCPAIINALSNLQPLWAKDNLAKGAKYD